MSSVHVVETGNEDVERGICRGFVSLPGGANAGLRENIPQTVAFKRKRSAVVNLCLKFGMGS